MENYFRSQEDFVKRLSFVLLVLVCTLLACQPVTTSTAPSTLEPAPVVQVETLATALPSETPSPTASPTATLIPAGVIHVDTLEQEVYPFVENGKCSLAEAIFAANAGQPKDSCAAGVPGETVIELMPGEYHLTQRDRTPPQVDWMSSLLEVGDAFPPVIFPLTLHGNGAVLIRDDGAESFRFFEVMVNSKLTLDHVTLQGGDVGDDSGGAVHVSSGALDLRNVHFINNRAHHGGAIYIDLSGLNIQDGVFEGNYALNSGGAIYVSSSKTTLQNTRFESNLADSEGGGLYADTVTLLVTGNMFLKNRVTGKGYGSRGGGMYLSHVNLTVTDSQFYQNESPMYGGAISINNPILAGIDPEEGDPIEQLQQSPVVMDFLTSIPGFQATLEAHPSGVFVDFHEDAQIHNNCFANNITINPEDPNWTSGLLGRASMADGNYWGDPSGPSGMGPGRGDSVGKRLTFAPFLTEPPEFCDPEFSQIK
jgi:predicted outer membrane repeat protein